MAAPTIPNGEEQFFPIIYEGNGAGQRVGKFVPFTDNGTIANSCIFNDDDLPRLYRQISAGNRKTYTISLWFKLGKSPPTDGAGFWSTSPSNDSGYGGNPSPYNLAFLQFVSGAIEIQDYEVSGNHYIMRKRTNRTFEDTSKWYHFLMAVDTTQSTESDRMKMYIDGDLITSFNDLNSSFGYPDQNEDTGANKDTNYDVINIGYNQHWDGCIAEFNFVDGTALTPDTFGVTDTSTGRWVPKALTGITYGTNGYRLQFGSSSNFGDDTSGNNNDFSVSNLVAGDQTTDSPTQNHATWNPHPNTGGTLSEGNLKLVTASSGYSVKLATLKPKSGKYYAEFTIGAENGGLLIGVQELATAPSSSSTTFPQGDGSFAWRGSNGYVFNGGSSSVAGSTYTTGDVLALALDLDNQVLKFYKNNSLDNTIGLTGKDVGIAVGDFGNAQYGTVTANFGQKSFTYTPPTGFVALQQDNLPETSKGVSGLVWTKNRDSTDNHQLYDSSRGKQLVLASNTISADTTVIDGLQKFLKGGQQIEDNVAINTSGESYVSWNWVANSGTTSTNNDGSLTSTVQANTTAGFSIIEYTGNGVVSTIGHGLSQAPEWFIVFHRGSLGSNNYVYHKSMGADYMMYLNLENARYTGVTTPWNDTAPTSSVINLMSTGYGGNNSGADYLIYAWHGVDGFSKFGSYTGNGSTDGPFVYTGFKPAWLLYKNITSASQWRLYDSSRNTFNPVTRSFRANSTNAEATGSSAIVDFLSNGFKQVSGNYTDSNQSGQTYIYMAFAEHPFVGDGTNPVTAR